MLVFLIYVSVIHDPTLLIMVLILYSMNLFHSIKYLLYIFLNTQKNYIFQLILIILHLIVIMRPHILNIILNFLQ